MHSEYDKRAAAIGRALRRNCAKFASHSASQFLFKRLWLPPVDRCYPDMSVLI
jgi:hypothetical protein